MYIIVIIAYKAFGWAILYLFIIKILKKDKTTDIVSRKFHITCKKKVESYFYFLTLVNFGRC